MLCERSYGLLLRMLLKSDEGGGKIRRGVAENGDFRQGGHYPVRGSPADPGADRHGYTPTRA